MSPKATFDRSGRGGQKWTDHPVRASKVASQLFLIAQPPLLYEEGTTSIFAAYVPTRNCHTRKLNSSVRLSICLVTGSVPACPASVSYLSRTGFGLSFTD